MTEAERVRLAQAELARDVYRQALIEIRMTARDELSLLPSDKPMKDIYVIAQTALGPGE